MSPYVRHFFLVFLRNLLNVKQQQETRELLKEVANFLDFFLE